MSEDATKRDDVENEKAASTDAAADEAAEGTAEPSTDIAEAEKAQGGDDSDPSAEEGYADDSFSAPAPGLIENWEDGDEETDDQPELSDSSADSSESTTNTDNTGNGVADATPSGDAEPYNTDDVPAPPPPFPFEEGADADLSGDNAEDLDPRIPAEEVTEDGVVRGKNLIADAEAVRAAEAAAKGEAGEAEDGEEEAPVTLMDHLDELRFRLVRCAIGVIVGCLGCYAFAQQLFDWLVAPLVQVMPANSTLIYTGLPEAFFTYIKISLVAGAFVVSPFLFYQIWAFVSPGLYDEEKRYLAPIALVSAIFFTGGAAFAYYIVFPFAFEFFMSFNVGRIVALPSLKEYLAFAIKLLFAFGLIFELPLFAFFLSKMGIVTATMMRNFRKYAVLCSFIVSAILTPPDVVSQLLMAGPLLVLFEISIIVAAVFGKKKTLVESALGSGDDEEEDENDEEAESEEHTA